jgi:3-dehydroquinate dehydratase-2
MDSLKACKLAIYEVHISNIYKREDFRHTSYISKVATGVISGFAEYGYIAAINHIYITKDRYK